MKSEPSLSSAPIRGPRRSRRPAAAVATAVLAGAAAAGGYVIHVRSQRPPHFSRGGPFLAGPSSSPSVPDVSPGAVTTAGPADASPPPPGGNGRSPAGTVGPPVGGRTAAAAIAPAPTTPRTPPSAAPAASAPAASPLPGLGTYTWSVQGTESATGFGSRSLPPTMTMTAHRDAASTAAEVVFDLAYSQDHTEREIVSYDDQGVGLDFEGGQVRFGPMAQTNEGTYRPALLQIPGAAPAGTVRAGRSVVTSSSGSQERTEDWKVTSLGNETLTTPAGPVPTRVVKVERQTTADSSQQVHRTRTYWYDDARRLWVKYTEQMHGEQRYAGVTFTYDDDLTAVLTGFSPTT